jgi:hypothetical protein
MTILKEFSKPKGLIDFLVSMVVVCACAMCGAIGWLWLVFEISRYY